MAAAQSKNVIAIGLTGMINDRSSFAARVASAVSVSSTNFISTTVILVCPKAPYSAGRGSHAPRVSEIASAAAGITPDWIMLS